MARIYHLDEVGTIHGVKQVSKSRTKFTRFCSLIFLSGFIGFCLWQMSGTLNRYLKYSTKTSRTTKEIGIFQFPAITLCPDQIYLRSFIGGSPVVYTGAYFNSIGEDAFTSASVAKYTSICNYTGAPWIDLADNKFGDINYMKSSQVDSYRAVKQCKINGLNFNCSQYFLNKVTELGWCFTFNSGQNILKTYKLEGESNTPNVYGTQSNISGDFPMSGGMTNGLSLLVFLNKSECCVPVGYHGFLVVIHEKIKEPYLSQVSMTRINVGYANNIAIRFKQTVRNTEEYGYCHSQLPLKYFPTNTEYTSKDTYVTNCLSELIVKKCRCPAYFAPPIVRELHNFSSYTCGGSNYEEMVCFYRALKLEYRTIRSCFKDVPIPCRETKIMTTSTAAIFPTKKMFSRLKKLLKLPAYMTLKEFRLNFGLGNFFLGSKNYEYFQEDIKMTWIDLMNQFGGTMGMCLGISILSLMELITFMSLVFFQSWTRRVFKKNEMKIYSETLNYLN